MSWPLQSILSAGRHKSIVCVLTLLAALAGANHGLAQTTNTWMFDGNGVWHNAANWTPATIPNAQGSAALLGGSITEDRTIRYDNNVKLGTLTFANDSSFTLSGFGTLTFDTPGTAVTPAVLSNSGAGSPEITSLINLLDNLNIIQNGSGILKLTGDIGTTPRSVTKTGAGILELGGVNSFGGGLYINQGTVRAFAEQSLGNGTNIVLNGGTLNIGANITSDNTRSYSVTNSGTFDIDTGFVMSITNNGRLRGSGAVIKAGGGTLALTGDNSTSLTNATVTIIAGTVKISAENNLGALNNDVIVSGGTLLFSQGFTASSGKLFRFTGSGGTLDVDENQTLTLGTTGQLVGTNNLTKAGLGTLVLSGDNSTSFSNATVTIKEGTVRVTAENNLGAPANDVTINGGTLNIGGTIVANGSKVINIGTNGGTLSIDGGSILTLGTLNQLSGSGTLIKDGTGTLTVQGNQSASQSGQMIVMNGTVIYSGTNGVTGTGGFTINRGGSVIFDNGTTLNGNRSASSFQMDGGKLRLIGNSATTFEALGVLTLVGNSSIIEIQRAGNATVTFGSLVRSAPEATIHFGNIGSGTLGNQAKISFTTAPSVTNSILGGWATASGTSAGTVDFASMTGTNVVALAAWNTGNQSGWIATDNAKPGGDNTLTVARTNYSLTLANSRDVNLAGNNLTIQSGGLIAQGTSIINNTGGAGFLTAGKTGSANSLYVHVATNGLLTISATITNNGSGVVTLVKVNDGKLILSGTNGYTGGTFINGGVLQLGSASAIPNSSPVSIDYGAILNLTNFSETIGSLSGRGTVLLGSATLTAGGNNSSTEFEGGISGTGGLSKTGTGVLTLSGTNSYTGNTTINNGVLSVSRESNLGNATNDVIFAGGAGTLLLTGSFTANTNKAFNFSTAGTVNVASNQTVTLTRTNQIVGTGNLVKAGAGTLIVGGASNYTGSLVINGGELQVAGSYSNVNSFLSNTRVTNLTGSGGTLTWAFNNENFTNTISAATGASGTNIFLGFDVVGTTNTWYVYNGSNVTWAGLTINGGNVQPQTNLTFSTANSSLQLNGGNFYVGGGNPTGGKIVTFQGNLFLRGGTLQGAPGGGSHGTVVTHGNITSSGTILVNGPSITMIVDNNTATTVINGTTPLNGITDLTKQGPGTVRIDQAITASSINIEQGTLLLGGNNRINDGANVAIQNATLATGGYNETLGTLTLLNNAFIDMGANNTGSYLAFANSSLNNWGNYTLTITNYFDSTEAIFFGTTSGGLTSDQLAQIRWQDPYGTGSGLILGSIIESDGRIRPAPVPELNSIISFMMIGVAVLCRKWRKEPKQGAFKE